MSKVSCVEIEVGVDKLELQFARLAFGLGEALQTLDLGCHEVYDIFVLKIVL